MGECSAMSLEERKGVIRTVCAEADDVPVLAGVNDNSIVNIIELANASKEAGAAAMLLTPPHYIPYDDEQILLELTWKNKADIENLCLRVEVSDYRRYPVTAFVVENFYSGKKGETHTAKLKIDISKIVRGGYYTRYVFYSRKNDAAPFETLEVADGLTFRRRKPDKYQNTWQKAWGSIEMNDIEVV